jgi:lipoprotein signal peptidase
VLWTFVAVFAAYFWFLSLALIDQRHKDGDPPLLQLGTFRFFWGSSSTPIGKGAAYLRKVEAKDPRELAITQLKGLKLLMWVCLLKLLHHGLLIWQVDFSTAVGVPSLELERAIAEYVAGNLYPRNVCWLILIYSFLADMMLHTIWGGIIVATARLAGFRLLRNTCRPLSSRSMVDFWNRYYFYYKELLVEIFFFPTFLRWFKKNQRLRLFVATIMAATVGNFIYHFMRDIRFAVDVGLLQYIQAFQVHAFYCVVLGVAIGLSQARIHRRAAHPSWIRARLLPSAGVLGFFCILQVFATTYTEYSLANRFSFIFHMFGVD